MTAPRWVAIWFRVAAVYGVVALLASLTQPAPSLGALTHYGFIGTALAFQGVFWIVARDPVRHRPLMLASVAEKAAFTIPAAILLARGTVPPETALFAGIDAVLGIGFLLAWRATPRGAD